MATAAAKDEKPKSQLGGYKDKFWYLRFWQGMVAGAWFPVLWQARFRVHPKRFVMSLIISISSVVNSLLGWIQCLIWGWRVRKLEIGKDPIFIVGHWRSGTTLLHELLVLDSRHTYPTTYECFAPTHFLLTGWVMPALLKLFMPKQRPMDNMAAGWNLPQEDEFGLANMGARSPYTTFAFPNEPPQNQEYLTLESLTPAARERWKGHLVWLLKCIWYRRPKRIVLKSPPHTGRIKTLLEIFPNARFVHIVRDPNVLFASTVNLWKRLYKDEGFQVPHYEGLEEHVFTTLVKMYDAFERDRELVDPSRICDVRYEDLTKDILGQMHKIYDQLQLGGFEEARPAMEKYVAEKKDYKTNRYEMDPELKAEISRRWSEYCQKYGYSG